MMFDAKRALFCLSLLALICAGGAMAQEEAWPLALRFRSYGGVRRSRLGTYAPHRH